MSQLDDTLNSILARVATEVAQAVREDIAAEVVRVVSGLSEAGGARKGGLAGASLARTSVKGARPTTPVRRPCPFPGCKRQSTGPRFSWFCALHRDLPKEERDKIRAARRA